MEQFRLEPRLRGCHVKRERERKIGARVREDESRERGRRANERGEDGDMGERERASERASERRRRG